MILVDNIIDKNTLIDVNENLLKIDNWQIGRNTNYWSTFYIDVDFVYKVSRILQRFLEEFGLSLQLSVSNLFDISDTIFPDYSQLVKINKDSVLETKNTKSFICKTVTFLSGDNEGKTFIFDNNKDLLSSIYNNKDVYAICMFWSKERNKMYPNWFMSKFLRKYYE